MTDSNNYLLCPKVYDTEGLFNGFHNEDPNEKCVPKYDYDQCGKIVGGGRLSTYNINGFTGYPSRKSGQTGINNQFALGSFTGGNISRIRQVGRDRTPMTIGNSESKGKFNSSRNESFRERMTSDIPEFTTMPTTPNTGKSSMLQPQLRAPDLIYERRNCSDTSIADDITNSLSAFKDGVVYSITFGKKDTETFCPGMGYNTQQNIITAGKVVGAIITFIIIWFAIAFITSAILYAWAAVKGGCYSPARCSNVATIFVPMSSTDTYTECVGKQCGGNKSGITRFFNTVGQVMMSPFNIAVNSLVGGNKRKNGII